MFLVRVLLFFCPLDNSSLIIIHYIIQIDYTNERGTYMELVLTNEYEKNIKQQLRLLHHGHDAVQGEKKYYLL